MLRRWIGLTRVPAESLPTFDLQNIATLVGVAVGTAIAVFVGYKKTKASPAPLNTGDVVIPTATIASLKPLEQGLLTIAASIDSIHASMQEWRAQDVDAKRWQQLEAEAFRRGQIYEQSRTDKDEGRRRERRRPNAE